MSPSTTRREQAEQTRSRILDTAYRLMCAQGYEPTTMQQVADEAGVAVQTVYLNFRTKARLLAAVEDRVILGDQPAERWPLQPWAEALRDEPDPRRLLELFVAADQQIKSRVGPFVAAVGPALSGELSAVNARDRGRDEFFRTVVDRLSAMGALRSGLDPERALDIVRAVNTIEAYVDLTTRRGWTGEDWCSWLGELLAQQLLGPPQV